MRYLYRMDLNYLIFVVLVSGICLVKGNKYLVFYSEVEIQGSTDTISLEYSYHTTVINNIGRFGPGATSSSTVLTTDEMVSVQLDESVIPTKSKDDEKLIGLSSTLFLQTYATMVYPQTGNGVIMAINNVGPSNHEFYLTMATPKTGYETELTIAVAEDTQISIYNKDNERIVETDVSKNQVYNFRSPGDLSGYKVVSDVPAGLIAGTRCSDIGTECNMVKSYIPPTERLGELHIVPQIPGRADTSDPSTIRVVATVQNTAVRSYDRTANGIVTRTTLSAGQFYDLTVNTNKPTFIECSQKCLVSLLMKPFNSAAPYPTSSGKVSGPLLLLVPPIHRWETDIKFVVPSIDTAQLYALTIVTPKDTRDVLRLNGNTMAMTWQDVDSMPLNTSGTVRLTLPGEYRLTSTSSDVPFIAWLFVHSPTSSFGGCLNSYRSVGDVALFTPTIPTTVENTGKTPTREGIITLPTDPSRKTPSTTISTTNNEPKVTPTVEIRTVPLVDPFDVDYPDPTMSVIYTRRPTVPTTTEEPVGKKRAQWEAGVIVVVFLFLIAVAVVVGYFLIQRSWARANDKRNAYMGQARAEFTSEGMVESRVAMGEKAPPIEMVQGKSTMQQFQGKMRNVRDVLVSGFDTVRAKTRDTFA